jgi:hypothetical protein
MNMQLYDIIIIFICEITCLLGKIVLYDINDIFYAIIFIFVYL